MTKAQIARVLQSAEWIKAIEARRATLVNLHDAVRDYGSRGLNRSDTPKLLGVTLHLEGSPALWLTEREQTLECFRSVQAVITTQIKRLDDELAAMTLPS